LMLKNCAQTKTDFWHLTSFSEHYFHKCQNCCGNFASFRVTDGSQPAFCHKKSCEELFSSQLSLVSPALERKVPAPLISNTLQFALP
jgi:hypothetical protein